MAKLTMTVDTTKLMDALAKFKHEVLARHLRQAAEVTAHRVASDARARVAARTGQTRASITVAPSGAAGFRVVAGVLRRPTFATHVRRQTGRLHTQKVTQSNVPLWLEFGTKHMVAQPFFFASAKLETDAYRRRVVQAIEDAAQEVGLGG